MLQIEWCAAPLYFLVDIISANGDGGTPSSEFIKLQQFKE
jgi:hypothetical protein